MAIILSLSNHKGGVGKTTSSVNISAALAKKFKKKVLVIDLDPQSNLTQSFGLTSPEKTIYGALSGEHSLSPLKLDKYLYIIPSTIDLSGAEVELSSEAGREFILRDLLEEVSAEYDYIIIDCPPSLGLLTINALSASDYVLIPLQTQFLAMQGLTKLMEVMEKVKKRLNKKLNLGGVFLTQYDGRKTLDRDVVASIEQHFKGKVFNTKIRNTVSLAEAPSQGKDIFDYNSKSMGASDYIELTKEILKIQ